MIDIHYKFKIKTFILSLVLCQLLSISCSKQLYPDSSFPNIKKPGEKSELNDFMDIGIEKEINSHDASADEIIKTAMKYLGVPHCMGGTTIKCMDCSGLLVTVFASHGIKLPHNAEEQARYGRIMAGTDKLLKGDLVFFIRSYRTNNFITHSGIYIGNNQFIHASSTKGVTITSIKDPWWIDKYIFGTRILEN